MADQLLANRPTAPGNYVDHAGRCGGGEDFGQHQRRQRRLRGRFDDHRVPGGQGRSCFEGQQQQGVVPGDQGGDHAVRDTHDQRELTGFVGRSDASPVDPGQLGVLTEQVGEHVDIEEVAGVGPAGLEGDGLRQILLPIQDLRSHSMHRCAAYRLRGGPPRALGTNRGRNCSIDLVGRGGGHGVDGLTGGGIQDDEQLGGADLEGSVNQ